MTTKEGPAQIGTSANLSPKPAPEQIGTSANLSPKLIRLEAPKIIPPSPSPKAKKVRGRNKKTNDLIEVMRKIAEEMRPITGRGVGYKLFTRKLIESVGTSNMKTVYRALKLAREDGIIPWDWIIDETRDLEKIGTWQSGSEAADSFFYRRDLWQTQDVTVEVWSEKGTVRGVLLPVLHQLGVGFRVMHGFSSATCVWNVCNEGNDDRPLIALYVGDRDPSGLCMTETDLPQRIQEYGGEHIELRRIALTSEQVRNLPSFSVEDKKKDPRYKWYKEHHGSECWELDAMDPRVLRDLVKTEIEALIDWDAWKEEETVQKREKDSIELALSFGCDPDSSSAELLRQLGDQPDAAALLRLIDCDPTSPVAVKLRENHAIDLWCSEYEALNDNQLDAEAEAA